MRPTAFTRTNVSQPDRRHNAQAHPPLTHPPARHA